MVNPPPRKTRASSNPPNHELAVQIGLALRAGLRGLGVVLSWLAAKGVAFLRWVSPHVQAGAKRGAREAHAAAGSVGRGAVKHRGLLFRGSHRILWWTALALLFVAGRTVMDGFATDAALGQAPTFFAIGLGLSAFVLLFASETRLRLGAFALATAHGAFAIALQTLGA